MVVPEINIPIQAPPANGNAKGATAAEPGKTIEENGDYDPVMKLDANNYGGLSASSPSIAESAVSQPAQHNFIKKLRKTKHSKR